MRSSCGLSQSDTHAAPVVVKCTPSPLTWMPSMMSAYCRPGETRRLRSIRAARSGLSRTHSAIQRVDVVDTPGLELGPDRRGVDLGSAEVRHGEQHQLRSARREERCRSVELRQEERVALGRAHRQHATLHGVVEDVPSAEEGDDDVGLHLIEEHRPALVPSAVTTADLELTTEHRITVALEAAPELAVVPHGEPVRRAGLLDAEAERRTRPSRRR